MKKKKKNLGFERCLRLIVFLLYCYILFVLIAYVPMRFYKNDSVFTRPPRQTVMPYKHKIPMVRGWEEGVSRNASLYIFPDNFTTIINKKNIPYNTFIQIIVFSAPSHFIQRSTIRDTWASLISNYENVAFLLGKTTNSTLQAMIKKESETYDDIIQEDFLDTYNNLTLKTLMMLKWMLTNSPARFLMKTDDDVFLNVPVLSTALSSVANHEEILVGSLACDSKPINNPGHKWFCPSYLYGGPVYPKYLLGPGYAMSDDVILKLFRAALVTPIVHLEDVYITGICALAAHVFPLHHHRFEPVVGKISASCDKNVITQHRMAPDDLRKSFSFLSNCSYVNRHINFRSLRLKNYKFVPRCPENE